LGVCQAPSPKSALRSIRTMSDYILCCTDYILCCTDYILCCTDYILCYTDYILCCTDYILRWIDTDSVLYTEFMLGLFGFFT
jgi:hypothetical protein